MEESPSGSWLEDGEWWLGAIEEDTLSSSLLLGGDLLPTFLPPPPRPSFLDSSISSCDLCGWTWQEAEVTTKGSIEGDLFLILDSGKANETTALNTDTPHELGWVLVTVSIVSAVLGAIIMVTAIQCHKLKNIRSRGVSRTVGESPPVGHGSHIEESHESDKGQPYSQEISAVNSLAVPQAEPHPQQLSIGQCVWMCLRSWRRHSQEQSPQVERIHHFTPENHYTLSSMDRALPLTAAQEEVTSQEAIYAELNHEESTCSLKHEDASYQNMAFQHGSETDPMSCHLSANSPPSSSRAYYSNFSMSPQANNARRESTYEAIDTESILPPPSTPNNEDIRSSDGEKEVSDSNGTDENASGHPIHLLPLTKTVPSNYV